VDGIRGGLWLANEMWKARELQETFGGEQISREPKEWIALATCLSSGETNGCPRREHRGRYDEPKEWIA
jgi:hypothetical protein